MYDGGRGSPSSYLGIACIRVGFWHILLSCCCCVSVWVRCWAFKDIQISFYCFVQLFITSRSMIHLLIYHDFLQSNNAEQYSHIQCMKFDELDFTLYYDIIYNMLRLPFFKKKQNGDTVKLTLPRGQTCSKSVNAKMKQVFFTADIDLSQW